jgi:hypothetical protein
MLSLRASAAAVLLAVTALAGPAGADPGPPRPDQPPAFRTETVWVDAPPLRHHLSHTLFVNRCVGGCDITPGDNDARANTSSSATAGTAVPW